MRFISADYIKAIMKNDRLMQGNCEYELWKQEVDKKVDAMPSIDIVRCKECGLWWRTIGSNYGDCRYFGLDTIENAYCSYGERKGE